MPHWYYLRCQFVMQLLHRLVFKLACCLFICRGHFIQRHVIFGTIVTKKWRSSSIRNTTRPSSSTRCTGCSRSLGPSCSTNSFVGVISSPTAFGVFETAFGMLCYCLALSFERIFKLPRFCWIDRFERLVKLVISKLCNRVLLAPAEFDLSECI
jgi:hypothetical protein